MQVGQNQVKDDRLKLSLNELTPAERKEALNKSDSEFPAHWKNEQFPGQGYTTPKIASKYGNAFWCDNDKNPNPKIPAEIFNFDLILGGKKFQVLCDTLIRIEHEENLADFSDTQLRHALELCASYRMTCFCAAVAARKEHRRWKQYHEIWMAEKREEARKHLRSERMMDKAMSVRKDLGQITLQEIEDYIITKYGKEYKDNLELIHDWEDNKDVYLELRDTLKDRGMHLQSILRMSGDHLSQKTSDGTSLQ